MTKIGEKWSSMSDSEKKSYYNKAHKENQKNGILNSSYEGPAPSQGPVAKSLNLNKTKIVAPQPSNP